MIHTETRRVPLYLIVVAFIVVAVWLAAILNIWIDEAYTLATTAHGLAHVIRNWRFEEQAPLYFLILSAIRRIDQSVLFARLFSVLSVAASVLAMNQCVRRLFPQMRHRWVALLIAAHPYAFWAASEIRVYGFALFLALTILLLEEWHREANARHSVLRSVAVGVVWAVSLYTHYYLGFVIAGVALSEVVTRGRAALLPLATKVFVCVALFAPMVPVVMAQVSSTSDPEPSVTLMEAAKKLYGRVKVLLMPYEAVLGEETSRWSGIIFVGTLSSFVLVFRHYIGKRHLRIWILTVVCFCCYVAAGTMMGPKVIGKPHVFALFPLILLSLAALMDVVASARHGSALSATMMGVVVIGFALGSVTAFLPGAKEGDYRRIARFLEHNEKVDQPVIVFQADAVLPLEHYYDGLNRLVPVPVYPSLVHYDYRSFAIQSPDVVAARLSPQGTAPDSMWFVDTSATHLWYMSYNRQYLDDYIAANYTVLQQTDFYGAQVRLLRKRSQDFTD